MPGGAVDFKAFFQPDLGGFIRYCLGFSLRYIICAGGLFVLLHIILQRKMLVYKIQQIWPTRREIRHEIFWSISNTICTGLVLLIMYYWIQNDYTQMYFTIGERGWPYFGLSVLLGIVGFDAWFYWQHRLLHTPWLFKHGHSVHHRVSNPTPLAAFAHHPIETLSEDLYFLLFVLVVPIHPIAFALVGLHAFTLGILGHMGYEFFPKGFTRHKIFKWHNTATHHNMHHSHANCNYSLYFNIWDRLMGTNHKDYDTYFESIKSRLDEAPPKSLHSNA